MKTRSKIIFSLALALATLILNQSHAAAFTNTGPLSGARAGHTATLLPNGKVLVVGGYNGTDRLASSELYDPATGTWNATGPLTTRRTGHTATLLPNGLVLVAGGGVGGIGTASCELYDPSSGTWADTGSLVTARVRQTATLLLNGKVLITGGSPDAGITSLSSAELYDPATGKWTATGSMSTARDLDTATLLLNGKVLVTGGAGNGDDYPLFSSAELFDPATGTWTPTGSMVTARVNQAATLLPDGRVLVTGGNNGVEVFSSAELYDPASGIWQTTSAMIGPHTAHTATLLPDGKVLVAAGYDNIQFIAPTSSAGMYDWSSGTWTATDLLNAARSWPTATLLPSGKVLIAGGYDIGAAVWLSSAELYNSAVGSITLVNPLKSPNSTFQFAFTGAANGTNTVLATTNPALPMANWTVLGIVPEFSPGLYLFSDAQAASNPQRFYRVRSP